MKLAAIHGNSRPMLAVWIVADVEPTSNGDPPPLFPPPFDVALAFSSDEAVEAFDCEVPVENVIKFVGVIGPTVVSMTATLVVVGAALLVMDGEAL